MPENRTRRLVSSWTHSDAHLDLVSRPLTTKNWRDFATLFGPNGACAGCWCMWWRMTRTQFAKQTGSANKRAMKRVVDSGQVPGILAYKNGQPIAWCSIAPRETYPVLERSRSLKRVDGKPVWSIVCFFVAKPFRRKGIMVSLIEAAAQYARQKGAKIVEAYPLESDEVLSASVAYTGFVSAFRKAGFKEVVRRSERRSVVRLTL